MPPVQHACQCRSRLSCQRRSNSVTWVGSITPDSITTKVIRRDACQRWDCPPLLWFSNSLLHSSPSHALAVPVFLQRALTVSKV